MRHYWPFAIIAAPVVLGFVFVYMVLNGRPLNAELAYDAVLDQLRRSITGNPSPVLAPARVVYLSGAMIWSGEGTSNYAERRKFELPVLETTNFEYLLIIKRQCHDWYSACYKAEQIEVTGTKTFRPFL